MMHLWMILTPMNMGTVCGSEPSACGGKIISPADLNKRKPSIPRRLFSLSKTEAGSVWAFLLPIRMTLGGVPQASANGEIVPDDDVDMLSKL